MDKNPNVQKKGSSEIFNGIVGRLKEIQKIMNFSDEALKLLSESESIHESTLNLNGEKITAWRVVHNKALGPGKGGIRFHQNVSLDEVRSLAFWMALKNSLAGLPYGGAKGGVKFDPKKKSKKEIEEISRQFIQKNYEFIGENKDIPAPDVYTNEQVMAWMLDEYEKIIKKHEPGMLTGKPIVLGGLTIRSDATAKGGFIVIKELLKDFKITKDKPTIAIQGFGNAGLNITKMLSKQKAKIVAVSDSKGGIYDENGFDTESVIKEKETSGTVTTFKNANVITNEELLSLPVDILVLAALENQITEKNANHTKAKYIVELANGPINPEADKILYEKNITVVPDILANSGGVVASYFEWAQNKSGGLFENEFLEKKLESIMKLSWKKVFELYHENGKIDLRTSAYIIAIKRILSAEQYRGRLNN